MEDMAEIHESIVRLYRAAKEFKNVAGQSAVARLLDQTPQTVKNWEKRGISEGGALIAQRRIGVDANWVMDGQGTPAGRFRTPSEPANHSIQERPPTYQIEHAWPFTQVTREQYGLLTEDQKKVIETTILAFSATVHPPKQQQPEKDKAA